MTKPLFICLDLQRVFLTDGPLRTPHAGDALIHCRRLLKIARDHRWTIVHCHLRRPNSTIAVYGQDACVIEGFEPTTREPVLERFSLSAYGHRAFGARIEDAAPNIVIAGLSASLTWIATAFDAFEHGHRFAFMPEALAGQHGLEADANAHAAVARDVARHLGFSVLSAPAAAPEQSPRLSHRKVVS